MTLSSFEVSICTMLHYVALFPRTAVTFAVVIGKDCSGQSLGHCGALFGCGQVAHFESQNVISLPCLV